MQTLLTFFSRETRNVCNPGKINAHVRGKIRDANKRAATRTQVSTYSPRCYFKVNIRML